MPIFANTERKYRAYLFATSSEALNDRAAQLQRERGFHRVGSGYGVSRSVGGWHGGVWARVRRIRGVSGVRSGDGGGIEFGEKGSGGGGVCVI